MGSFDTWEAADEAWRVDNADLVNEVFQWLLRNSDWPKVTALQHEMYKRTPRILDVQSKANDFPTVPGLMAPAMKEGIRLGARHLIHIPEAQYLLGSTVLAARTAAEIFLATPAGEHSQLAIGDLPISFPNRSSTTRELVPAVMSADPPAPLIGGFAGPDWSMGIDPALVMEFEDVKDPHDYVERQLSVIRRWADDYDRRTGNVPKAGPLLAFVVMPFGEQWSDAMHAVIKRVVAAFEGQLTSVRADEIAAPGKITEQIVQRLQEADIVISDITGANPNVAWELGYAFAYDKPSVILRSRASSDSAPFDIYDHRRVEYSEPPTEEEETRIQTMVESAIAQAREKTAGNSVNFGTIFRNS